MRLKTATWVAAIWASLGGMALAGGPVVVELYTSQGCSSCPPADKILGDIAERDDVIALALHVDYWDYIGWKDAFADPSHTDRQRAYSRAAGQRTIYTPQMVVGGQDHIIGSKPMQLARVLEKHRSVDAPVDVTLRRAGGKVTIRAAANGRLPKGGAVVQLVTFTPQATVAIKRGENAGRTLEYHNIVRDLSEIGRWDGTGTYQATVNVPDDQAVAVLIQGRNAGPMLGAAKLR